MEVSSATGGQALAQVQLAVLRMALDGARQQATAAGPGDPVALAAAGDGLRGLRVDAYA